MFSWGSFWWFEKWREGFRDGKPVLGGEEDAAKESAQGEPEAGELICGIGFAFFADKGDPSIDYALKLDL